MKNNRPPKPDIWAEYDPDNVRGVLKANAAIPGRIDPSELEDILADIKGQRGQDSTGRPAKF